VRSELRKAFETKLPSYKLSEAQFEQLTDDIMTIREAREKMNALPFTPENAEEHRRLREQLGKAVADFQDVADISLQEFTKRPSPKMASRKRKPNRDESIVLDVHSPSREFRRRIPATPGGHHLGQRPLRALRDGIRHRESGVRAPFRKEGRLLYSRL